MSEYRKRRSHKRATKDFSRVMRLSNGQFLATIPRELARWKKVEKGTLLRWSDGGMNRIIVEVMAL